MKPVPSDIYGPDAAHYIIFDYCHKEQKVTETYFAQLDEDPGYGYILPEMTLEQAEHWYGEITVSRNAHSKSYFFKANWGWGPFADDPEINGILLNVINGGDTYNQIYMMTYDIYN